VKKKRKERTYEAHRLETVADPELPLGHATVSGFNVIPPPQANPVHVKATGLIISTIVSKDEEESEGMARRKMGFDPRRVICK